MILQEHWVLCLARRGRNAGRSHGEVELLLFGKKIMDIAGVGSGIAVEEEEGVIELTVWIWDRY